MDKYKEISPKNRCPNCGYYGRMEITYTVRGNRRIVDDESPLLKCPRCGEVF